MPADSILVVNAGSSSVKFQVFSIGADNGLSPFLKGQFDGIGTRPRLRATADSEAVTIDQMFDLDKVPDVATAMQVAGAWVREQFDLEFAAVGHRVVHGGAQYDQPVLVDETVLAELTRLGPLAPLHQPNNLAPINALRARFPELLQVACFDTAFHRGHSAVADHFAIPQRFYAEGVRRYGFHGLSYEYVAGRLQEIAPDVAKGRVIVAHLGRRLDVRARRRPQRRKHNGVHRPRRTADGHAAWTARPGGRSLSLDRKRHERRRVTEHAVFRMRAEGAVRYQQRCSRSSG
jgi:acetate kinase